MSLFFVVLAVFAFCILAMAVGIIIRNKGFTTCGRAAAQHDGSCSVCGVSSGGSCAKDKDAADQDQSRT